jgi:hypothetical protein
MQFFVLMVFLVFSQKVIAEPISFGGMTMLMSEKEQIQHAKESGFPYCKEAVSPRIEIQFGKVVKSASIRFLCAEAESEEKVIPGIGYLTITDGEVRFPCTYFKGCEIGIETMKEKIEQKYKIKMSKKSNTVNSGFCGRGQDGDEICVWKGKFVDVTLKKSELGAAAPDF